MRSISFTVALMELLTYSITLSRVQCKFWGTPFIPCQIILIKFMFVD